jgi:hypothetical protein
MSPSYKHIFCRRTPTLLDIDLPHFQQGLRDIVQVRVPEAPVPQLRGVLIFVGTQAKLLYLLFKPSRQGRNGNAGLAPVGIAASSHTILQTP